MVTELQRFPFLRKCMDEVIGSFLQEGLQPSETMITHVIEMEVHLNLIYLIIFYVEMFTCSANCNYFKYMLKNVVGC